MYSFSQQLFFPWPCGNFCFRGCKLCRCRRPPLLFSTQSRLHPSGPCVHLLCYILQFRIPTPCASTWHISKHSLQRRQKVRYGLLVCCYSFTYRIAFHDEFIHPRVKRIQSFLIGLAYSPRLVVYAIPKTNHFLVYLCLKFTTQCIHFRFQCLHLFLNLCVQFSPKNLHSHITHIIKQRILLPELLILLPRRAQPTNHQLICVLLHLVNCPAPGDTFFYQLPLQLLDLGPPRRVARPHLLSHHADRLARRELGLLRHGLRGHDRPHEELLVLTLSGGRRRDVGRRRVRGSAIASQRPRRRPHHNQPRDAQHVVLVVRRRLDERARMLLQHVHEERGGVLLVLVLEVALVASGGSAEGEGRARAHEGADGQGEGLVETVVSAKPIGQRAVFAVGVGGGVQDARLAEVQDQLDLRRLHLLMQSHDLESPTLQIHLAHDLQHGRGGVGGGLSAGDGGEVALLDELVPCEAFEFGQVRVVDQFILVPRCPDHIHRHLRRPGHQMRVPHVPLHQVVAKAQRVQQQVL